MKDAENGSKELLGFLKEESQRQAERDNAFLNMMGAFMNNMQQPTYQFHQVPGTSTAQTSNVENTGNYSRSQETSGSFMEYMRDDSNYYF